jgi:hypothetical protein
MSISMKKRYPSLAGFLGAYIADEGSNELEIAREFMATVAESTTTSLVKESHELLLQDNFPWQELSIQANRYFENPEEAREWLKELISAFESVRASE